MLSRNCILFLLLLGSLPLGAAEAPLDPKAVALLKQYCYDCHDDAVAKAKLSLETLPLDFLRSDWVRVHDRLAAAEMPPKGKPQPTAEERQFLVSTLATRLTAAADASHTAQGRVLLRRMNRREFETTLHDLLGIATPLQNVLPEDNPVHGFDTVSRGLETSAAHLLSYQRAVDLALDDALPAWPIINATTRMTGRQFLDSRPKPNREGTAPFVRFEGDTIVFCATLYKHGSITTIPTPAPGRYCIRASVRAVNNGGKPIPVIIGKISSDRFAHEKLQHLLDIQDAPAGDQSRVIEVETLLPRGEQIYLEGVGLTFFQEQKKQRNGKPIEDNYAGPGLAVDWIELAGPLDAGVGYERLFGDLPQVPSRYLEDTLARKPVKDDWKKWGIPGEYSKYPLTPVPRDARGDANRLIRNFLSLAFRRPPVEERAAYYVKLVHDQIDRGVAFHDAMHAAYKAILCSAHFVSYPEPAARLDDYALAARLARFLWSSMPDAELSDLASKGKLSDPATLRAQTERMLKDPKSARFARSFVDQWLDLSMLLEMKPDDIYVEWDDMLAWSIGQETREFFDEVLGKDLSTSSFFHSDWTFLNSRLCKHYGLPVADGLELHRTPLPADSHRGGVITQASVLKLTTNASYTSPIKRGAWLLERILGTPPPPPPPDIKAVEPDIRGATTIREQLDKHKNVPVCASCHVRIDPPGFALESFDVIGGLRDRYRVKQGGGKGTEYLELPRYPGKKVWLAKSVQADGQTAAGEAFADIDSYKQIILKNPDQLTRNLAEKLIIYATGAEIDFADRAELEKIVQETKAKNHGFRSLVHAVVQSPLFRNK